MILKLLVNEQSSAAYDECLLLIDRLSVMSVEERNVEYGKYQWLFPKSKRLVSLDDQLSNRQDYKSKFKEWFFVVCKYLFCPSHLGQCSYSIFQERCLAANGKKNTSDRYSQKVILALGMMGYITKIKKNYSNCSKGNNHGMLFEIDLLKLNQWNKELDILIKIEREDVNLDDYQDWKWKQQYHTIMDIKVDPYYLSLAKQFLEDFSNYEKENDMRLRKGKKFCASEALVNIGCKSSYDIVSNHKADNYGGRFYTPMTQLRKELRQNCITLDMERLCEIDIASAQPTFLGLYVKKMYDIHTEWFEHCLNGDFYKWIKKICGTKVKRDTVKEYVMHYLYSYDDEIADKAHSKEYKRGYWRFEKRLNEYLEQYEPIIFEKIQFHKKNPEWDEKKKKWRNSLSRELVNMEVEYIKHCLSMIPSDIKFYTIHDCICCKQSDVGKVKQIMEQGSIELYGLTIRLKVENNEPMEVAV